MSIRVKMFLTFLGILAVFSVAYFQKSLKSSFRVALPNNYSAGTASLAPIDPDTDHDGLSDQDESYWNTDYQSADTDNDGFKDGEEVVSGHDPNIPGPDDRIAMENTSQNISNRVGELVLAGLYEGSLKPESPNFEKSVDMIVDEALRQYVVNVGETPENVLRLIPSTSENIAAYRLAMTPILENLKTETPLGLQRMFEAVKASEESDAQAFQNFFPKEFFAIDAWVARLEAVNIPENVVTEHNQLLNTLKALKQAYAALRDSDSDPFQAMIAYSLLPRMIFLQIPPQIKSFESLK